MAALGFERGKQMYIGSLDAGRRFGCIGFEKCGNGIKCGSQGGLEIATRLSAQRLSVCKLYANSRALPFHVALLHAAHCRASLQVGLQSALRTNRL